MRPGGLGSIIGKWLHRLASCVVFVQSPPDRTTRSSCFSYSSASIARQNVTQRTRCKTCSCSSFTESPASCNNVAAKHVASALTLTHHKPHLRDNSPPLHLSTTNTSRTDHLIVSFLTSSHITSKHVNKPHSDPTRRTLTHRNPQEYPEIFRL